MPQIVIIGATTWGTTLSIVLGNAGYNVQLLTRNKEEASIIEAERENVKLLPGFKLPSNITISYSHKECLQNADMLIFAVPSRNIRKNAQTISKSINASTIMIAEKASDLILGKKEKEPLDLDFYKAA